MSADSVDMAEAPPRADGALDLGVLRDVLGFHITLASIATVALFERHVGGPFNLRKAEFSLLMLLLANDATPAKHLARTLRLSSPNLTMLVDRMQTKALVAPRAQSGRSPLADDRAVGRGLALARRAQAAAKTMEHSLLRRAEPRRARDADRAR